MIQKIETLGNSCILVTVDRNQDLDSPPWICLSSKTPSMNLFMMLPPYSKSLLNLRPWFHELLPQKPVPAATYNKISILIQNKSRLAAREINQYQPHTSHPAIYLIQP